MRRDPQSEEGWVGPSSPESSQLDQARSGWISCTFSSTKPFFGFRFANSLPRLPCSSGPQTAVLHLRSLLTLSLPFALSPVHTLGKNPVVMLPEYGVCLLPGCSSVLSPFSLPCPTSTQFFSLSNQLFWFPILVNMQLYR